MVVGIGPPRTEKDTFRDPTPLAGLARSVTAGVGAVATVTPMLWVALAPVTVVATAVRVVVSGLTGTRAAKVLPCTPAGVPLTVTPTSRPPASMVPRTRTESEVTVAPGDGSVIWTTRTMLGGGGVVCCWIDARAEALVRPSPLAPVA